MASLQTSFIGSISITQTPIVPNGRHSELNVSVGNINPAGDWIVESTNDPVTGTPSTIYIQDFCDWAKNQATPSTPLATLPDAPKKLSEVTVGLPLSQKPPETNFESFAVIVKELKFNISQGTFNVNLQSTGVLQVTKNIQLSNVSIVLNYQ